MRGQFAVTGEVAAERGEPTSSYSRSDEWQTPGHSLFFIYYGVYRSSYVYTDSNRVKRLALISTLLYGLPRREKVGLQPMRDWYGRSLQLTVIYRLVYVATLLRLNQYVMRILLLFNAKSYFRASLAFLALPPYFLYRVVRAVKRRLFPQALKNKLKGAG